MQAVQQVLRRKFPDLENTPEGREKLQDTALSVLQELSENGLSIVNRSEAEAIRRSTGDNT